jgi:hypothetical protein
MSVSEKERERRRIYMRQWRINNYEHALKKERERYHRRKATGTLYKEDPAVISARNKKRNQEELKADSRRRRKLLLDATVAAYGGKCQCSGGCDESETLFLTIDHIFNDGASHRRRLGATSKAGVHIYRELQKQGYPKDRYRLMCFNCNCGRARNKGVCPHEEERP